LAGSGTSLKEGRYEISPGILLAALVVLVATQAYRNAVSPAVPYVVSLILGAIGLLGGEVIGLAVHLQGPPLGVIHPIPDLIAIAATEWSGSMMIGRRVQR
jgi:hypothetical protein